MSKSMITNIFSNLKEINESADNLQWGNPSLSEVAKKVFQIERNNSHMSAQFSKDFEYDYTTMERNTIDIFLNIDGDESNRLRVSITLFTDIKTQKVLNMNFICDHHFAEVERWFESKFRSKDVNANLINMVNFLNEVIKLKVKGSSEVGFTKSLNTK